MTLRGPWELSTARLRDLLLILDRAGSEPCTSSRLQASGFDGSAITLLIGMPANHAHALVSAVLAERTHRPRPKLELVWSGPESVHSRSRDTSQVLRELFEQAESRVIIAGFAFWGASTIFETLHRRAVAKHLEIEFFIHLDLTGQNQQMTVDSFRRYTWPWSDVQPTVYYDARTEMGNAGSMHAKCVVIDESATFITSANFTAAAHHTNVELGILVHDMDFAIRVGEQWRSLASSDLFVRLS